MDKELKLLLDNSKLDQLYKHNLFSIKSICEFLGVWNNYSSEDKFKLENFTKRDTNINKHFTYKGNYNNNFTYGEILRNGVDEIINKIKSFIPRDCDMKNKTAQCIKDIIEDYSKISFELQSQIFKSSFKKYALLYIKAERNFFQVRLTRIFF